MATYEFNDQIKFMLPADYIFSRDEDDDGNETVNIRTGEFENDDGETNYKYNCSLNFIEYDTEGEDEGITKDNLLDSVADRFENARRLTIPGTPKIMLVNKGMPLSIFGRILKMYAVMAYVQTDDFSFFSMTTTGRYDDDDPAENIARYDFLFEVLKAIRINGKKLNINSITPTEAEEALRLTFEEDGEAIDVSPTLKFNFTAGDETTTYEYTSEGMKEVGKERLTRVTPDEELYPHYKSIRSAGGLGFLGATVVVNASGTEYNFIPFRNAVNDSDIDDDMKALYNRVIAKDTESYDLNEKAKEMQKLFHVNASAFDPRHDRECELEEGLMHRAYMMSGLRSFAWTLADYCKQHDCTPEDIDNTIASRIANFVANEDWLNYDGKTYCQGLCSGSDLHVYYVPDGVTQADKKKLLPSKEDLDRVKQMKEKFPSYREILSEVHSLNALRKDLEYIYPAVKALWVSLEEERDYDEALLGNEADIVYAWCALALAAKEPFFSEDGPTSCFFSQPVDAEAQKAQWEAEESERAEEAAEQWMRKYEKYLETNPVITFSGQTFVFSGLAGHWAEKDDPIVKKVEAKGGQYRSKVSGLTNYLVVDPRYAGQSKIVAVMEQLQKGKKIKVILLDDLKNALDGKTASNKTTVASSKSTTGTSSTSKSNTAKTPPKASGTTAAPAQKVGGTKVSKSDCEIDYSDTLTAYNGSAKAIILPDGISAIGEDAFLCNDDITSVVIPEGVETIEDGAFWLCHNLKTVVLPSTLRKIGSNAFNTCEQLTSIIIPDGCEEIGADAFTSCKKLKDIYVPDSVYDIGDDAFYTFNDATVIHTSKGSVAESVAKENGWKVDYKSAPAGSSATSSSKSAAASSAIDNTGSLADTMDDLSAQISEMEGQQLSEEDLEKLEEARKLLGDIGDQLADAQVDMGKYGTYLEQKEAREKAEEEEKARKKAEAMAAGKSEKDIVNMYIILTNEKKLGQLHRNPEKFFEIYEEDFAALSKSEVLQTRNDILGEMEDDSLCSYYAESFKQRSVEERFSVSTRNLNNVSEIPDPGEKASWAVDNSKEWYTPEEYAEVRRLMDVDLADVRKQLDDQMKPIDEGWTKYSTGKESLQIVIKDNAADGSDIQPNFSNFQVVIGAQLVSVQIATKGMIRMSTTVMNCFPWYWGVTVRDIWEAARKNELRDEREGATNGAQLADQAMNQIRAKFPATKVTASSSSNTNTAYTPNYSASASNSNNYSSGNTQSGTVEYTVHYDLDGGTGRFPNQKKQPNKPMFIPKEIPQKAGYQFVCWYSDDKRLKKNRYNPGEAYYEDISIKLKAVWKSPNGYNSVNMDPVYQAPTPVQNAQPVKKKEGCYIATAVYGSYDAPQVMTLRRFRDETLRKTVLGRWFIRVYYRLSPPIAERLKNAKHINTFVRSILNKWVEKLNRKQR